MMYITYCEIWIILFVFGDFFGEFFVKIPFLKKIMQIPGVQHCVNYGNARALLLRMIHNSIDSKRRDYGSSCLFYSILQHKSVVIETVQRDDDLERFDSISLHNVEQNRYALLFFCDRSVFSFLFRLHQGCECSVPDFVSPSLSRQQSAKTKMEMKQSNWYDNSPTRSRTNIDVA